MSEVKDTVSLAFGNIFLSYPQIAFLNYNVQLGNYEVNTQQTFVSMMFYAGTIGASYWLFSGFRNTWRFCKDYLKSMFNGRKYTSSQVDTANQPNREETRYYAVIYGLNRGGLSFAKYLVQKGFNLILIDRDMQLLKDIEVSLRKLVRNEEDQEKLVIHKLDLIKFDSDTLRNKLIPLSNLPVKIFVNSKNSKRNSRTFHKSNKAIIEFENEYGQGNQNVQHSENNEQLGEELITRNEVYFSGRENVEGFSTLVSIFLYQMRKIADHPCVINIDNDEGISHKRIKRGQILFEATLAFQDTFTNLISKKFSDVKSINVKVNFKPLKDDSYLQKRLCDQAFSYLGIKETIRVQ